MNGGKNGYRVQGGNQRTKRKGGNRSKERKESKLTNRGKDEKWEGWGGGSYRECAWNYFLTVYRDQVPGGTESYFKYRPEWMARYSDLLRAGRSGDRIPEGGENFRTLPDRPWGPRSSLLYNGSGSFPGVKRPGRGVDRPPYLVPSTPPLGLRGLL